MRDKTARQIKAWVWYSVVKSKSKIGEKALSDYHLDEMFGTDEGGNPYEGAARLKMFEAIRVKGSIPRAKVYYDKKSKHRLSLIDAVENTEKFRGTATIISSPFWRLIDQKPLKLIELRSLIVECIKRLELEQVQIQENGFEPTPVTLRQWAERYPKMTIQEYLDLTDGGYDANYDLLLTSALIALTPSLDFIALVGGLALEANQAGNTAIAFNLESSFMTLIDSFCDLHGVGLFTQKSPNLLEGGVGIIQIQLKTRLMKLAGIRMRDALCVDKPVGLPDYKDMFDHSANPSSPIMVLLKKHEQILWNK